MGLIFDALMILYFGFAVFGGYKKGFLLSISGIAAFVISILIYRIFNLEYIYFIALYIVLLIVVGILAKLIRKLKIPLIAKMDGILGAIFGVFNGALGVFLISVLVIMMLGTGNFKALDSSFVLKIVEGILPF